jgi:hypothetical protein
MSAATQTAIPALDPHEKLLIDQTIPSFNLASQASAVVTRRSHCLPKRGHALSRKS